MQTHFGTTHDVTKNAHTPSIRQYLVVLLSRISYTQIPHPHYIPAQGSAQRLDSYPLHYVFTHL